MKRRNEPAVAYKAEAPRAIEYRRGDVRLYLYGAHAWLYRLMVGAIHVARNQGVHIVDV